MVRTPGAIGQERPAEARAHRVNRGRNRRLLDRCRLPTPCLNEDFRPWPHDEAAYIVEQ
jgi:hypothetical protein